MYKAAFIFSLCLFLAGCTHSAKNTRATAVANALPAKKSGKKDVTEKPGDTISFANALCPVNHLPFGPGRESHLFKSSKYYSALIYKNINKLNIEGWTPQVLKNIKIYKLPPIGKIAYLGLSDVDTGKCYDGQPFENFLKLSGYRYRLPDIYGYQCYYWCNYDYFNRAYTGEVKQNCDQCIINWTYGYLILYDKVGRKANVVTIYFNTFRDGSDLSRYFYIDRNYNIHIEDYSQEADDGDGSISSPIYCTRKFTISISNTGDFIVKRKK